MSGVLDESKSPLVVDNCRGGRCGRAVEGILVAIATEAKERVKLILRKEVWSLDGGTPAAFISGLSRCIE